jgi:hypothetical protein
MIALGMLIYMSILMVIELDMGNDINMSIDEYTLGSGYKYFLLDGILDVCAQASNMPSTANVKGTRMKTHVPLAMASLKRKT